MKFGFPENIGLILSKERKRRGGGVKETAVGCQCSLNSIPFSLPTSLFSFTCLSSLFPFHSSLYSPLSHITALFLPVNVTTSLLYFQFSLLWFSFLLPLLPYLFLFLVSRPLFSWTDLERTYPETLQIRVGSYCHWHPCFFFRLVSNAKNFDTLTRGHEFQILFNVICHVLWKPGYILLPLTVYPIPSIFV